MSVSPRVGIPVGTEALWRFFVTGNPYVSRAPQNRESVEVATMKTRISSELLKKIKDAVNIIDVVGEHVVLRKSGSNYTGLCPFHSERSPSFSVTATKQLYHCYGCKSGGDLVTFLEELHGICVSRGGRRAGRARKGRASQGLGGDGSGDPEEEQRRRAAREKLQTSTKLNRFVAAFYHQRSRATRRRSHYFRTRGVEAESGAEFLHGLRAGRRGKRWPSISPRRRRRSRSRRSSG